MENTKQLEIHFNFYFKARTFNFDFKYFLILIILNSNLIITGKSLCQSISEKDYGSKNYNYNDGTNPAEPVTKASFINSYFVDWKEFKDNRYYNQTILAGEYVVSKNVFDITFAIPFVTTNISFENKSGLGDISIGSDYIFFRKKNVALIAGLSFSFPTASENELGLEKYVIIPSAKGIVQLRKGFAGLILSYYKSLNGNNNSQSFINDRGDTVSKIINEISLLPELKYNFTKSFFTIIKPDMRYNFESERIFIPMTIEFGKYFHPHWVTSLTGGFHISNHDKRHDVNLVLMISYLIKSIKY